MDAPHLRLQGKLPFAFRLLSAKQKKNLSASFASRESGCERAVSLCLNTNNLISRPGRILAAIDPEKKG
jgi:hypothetical protein